MGLSYLPKFDTQNDPPLFRYNPDTHDVVGMAKKLEEVFEERYKNCPTGDEIAEVSPPPVARPATSHPPAGMLVHHTPSQVSHLDQASFLVHQIYFRGRVINYVTQWGLQLC